MVKNHADQKLKDNYANHGLPSANAKRNASELSPAKNIPQSKRHKKAAQKVQGNLGQESSQASPIIKSSSSSLTPEVGTCPKCKDLKPDEQCLWIIQVVQKNVNDLTGVVLTCASIEERLPIMVRFPRAFLEAKVNLF